MMESILDQTEVSKYLEPATEIPEDIIFKIYRSKEDRMMGDSPLGVVVAHKTIISIVSPVFRQWFFPGDNQDLISEVISIQDTTFPAFSAMVNLIYKKQTATDIFRKMSLSDCFETLSLADRYKIPLMRETIMEHFAKIVITEENLMETATVARQFKHQEKASDLVFNKCARFLMETRRTVRELLRFGKSHSGTDHARVALCLMSTMSDLKEEDKKRQKITNELKTSI